MMHAVTRVFWGRKLFEWEVLSGSHAMARAHSTAPAGSRAARAPGQPQPQASSTSLEMDMGSMGGTPAWGGSGAVRAVDRFSTESKARSYSWQKGSTPPSWNSFPMGKKSYLFSCLCGMIVSWVPYPREGARWLEQKCLALHSIWWIHWQVRVEVGIAFTSHLTCTEEGRGVCALLQGAILRVLACCIRPLSINLRLKKCILNWCS